MDKQTHRRLLAAGLLALLLTAGCAPKTEVVQPQPEIGVLNMAKAMKAQPRYAEIEKLQTERAALLAQLTQQEQEMTAARRQTELDLAHLSKAADQEFQTKMAARQAEINRRLQEEAQALQRRLGTQMDDYVRKLDADYQSNQFSLQAKLQLIDLGQEERTVIQKQIDELKAERARKIAARQQELAAAMNDSMKQAEQTATKELNEYGRQLQAELSAELDKKAQSMQTTAAAALSMPAAADVKAKLEANQQDLTRLQQEIINDIKQRAAAVAAKQGLTAVLADVEIFTAAARDITADVIAGSK